MSHEYKSISVFVKLLCRVLWLATVITLQTKEKALLLDSHPQEVHKVT